MIRQVALLACLALTCQGFVRLNVEEDAENKMSLARDPRSFLGDPQSDAYIDKILENLRQLILDSGMDPMDLPDISTGFSDTILGITWHGEANVRIIVHEGLDFTHLYVFLVERGQVLGAVDDSEDWRHQLHGNTHLKLVVSGSCELNTGL